MSKRALRLRRNKMANLRRSLQAKRDERAARLHGTQVAVTDHPDTKLALAINSTKVGWPWRIDGRPVDFERPGSTKLMDWMCKQSFWEDGRIRTGSGEFSPHVMFSSWLSALASGQMTEAAMARNLHVLACICVGAIPMPGPTSGPAQ